MSDKMKIEIGERKKNPLMKREEVKFSIGHKGRATPSRTEMMKEIASALKTKEELLIIDKIFTSTGNSVSSVRVLSYKKTVDIPKGKLDKMNARMEKVKKKADAKKEEKPAEAKPEEKKEDAKPEEVKGESKEEAKAEEKPAETGEKKE